MRNSPDEMSTPQEPNQDLFVAAWQVYWKMLDNNYLFHREAYGALHQVLAAFRHVRFEHDENDALGELLPINQEITKTPQRAQPQHRLGDFLSAAAAPDRHARCDARDAPRIAGTRVDVGLDDAGAHAVDAHTFRGVLLRETDRHALDASALDDARHLHNLRRI